MFGPKNTIQFLNALFNIMERNLTYIIHVVVNITFVVGMYRRIFDNDKMCRFEISDGHGHYMVPNQLPRSFRVFTIEQKTCDI